MRRTHAADVLRTLHAVATRSGMLHAISRDRESPLQGGPAAASPPTSQADALPPQSQSQQDRHLGSWDSRRSTASLVALDAHSGFQLLMMYLAAIIHDLGHK